MRLQSTNQRTNSMTEINKNSLLVRIRSLRMDLTDRKQLELRIVLSLAKKSTQVQCSFEVAELQAGELRFQNEMNIDCSDLDINRHKYCLIFFYEILDHGRKTPLGNVPINISQANRKGFKSYHMSESPDSSALLEAEVVFQSHEKQSSSCQSLPFSRINSISSLQKNPTGSSVQSSPRQDDNQTPYFKDKQSSISLIRKVNATPSMGSASNFNNRELEELGCKVVELKSPPKRNRYSAAWNSKEELYLAESKTSVSIPSFSPPSVHPLDPQSPVQLYYNDQDDDQNNDKDCKPILIQNHMQQQYFSTSHLDNLYLATKPTPSFFKNSKRSITQTISLQFTALKKQRLRISNVVSVQFRSASEVGSEDGSAVDQISHQAKDKSQEATYCKLVTITNINQRCESLKQRCQFLIAAMQKLVSHEVHIKNELESKSKQFDASILEYKNYVSSLNDQISGLTFINSESNLMIEDLQKKLKESNKLNEQYVREINLLKQTIKQNVTLMHDMRRDFYEKSKQVEVTKKEVTRPEIVENKETIDKKEVKEVKPQPVKLKASASDNVRRGGIKKNITIDTDKLNYSFQQTTPRGKESVNNSFQTLPLKSPTALNKIGHINPSSKGSKDNSSKSSKQGYFIDFIEQDVSMRKQSVYYPDSRDCSFDLKSNFSTPRDDFFGGKFRRGKGPTKI